MRARRKTGWRQILNQLLLTLGLELRHNGAMVGAGALMGGVSKNDRTNSLVKAKL